MAIPSLPSYAMPQSSSFPTSKVDWPFEPEKAALLIHDMQAYFVSFYDPQSELIQTLIRQIVALKQFCVAQGIPVIYTAQPKEQNMADRALLNDMWGPGLNRSPELQKVIDELTPTEQDTVLDKWRYSAFARSPLEHILKETGKDQLIICGIYGHIGCMITAVDAFMRDIKPFLVGDAIADFDLESHQMALQWVATRSGRVVSTADITGASAPDNTSTKALTKASLQAQLLSLIDEEEDEFDPDENLIDYGLDSVQIMSLLTEWRQQGVTLTFVELAKDPSLNHWWSLIEPQLGA